MIRPSVWMPLRAGWKVDESSRSRRAECRPARWTSCSGKRTRLRMVNPAAMKASVQAAAFCPVDPMIATFVFILVVAFVPSFEHPSPKTGARRVTKQIKRCGDSVMSAGFKNGGARLPNGLVAITKETNRSPLNELNGPLNVPSRGPAQTTARRTTWYIHRIWRQAIEPSGVTLRPFGSLAHQIWASPYARLSSRISSASSSGAGRGSTTGFFNGM